MKFVDPNTYASKPGEIRVSDAKWEEIGRLLHIGFLEKIKFNINKKKIDDWLYCGDTQPALVMSEKPLIISVYSDEMDAVVMLKFPDALAEKYGLGTGSRLTSSNVYSGFDGAFEIEPDDIAGDIHPGEKYMHQYFDFHPTISLFVSDNVEQINKHTEAVPEETWDYVQKLSEEYMEKYPGAMRDGFGKLRGI